MHSADFDQTFSTNDRGLRGPDAGPKAQDEFRIVVLGDSFVMGAEVPLDQRFTDRLEALLHQRGYTRVSVIGVGVRGWGTYNEAGFLQENIEWLQPDLLVLSLFVGNIGENVLATAAGYQLKGDNIAYGAPAAALEGDSVTWFDHNFAVGAAEYQQPHLPPGDWKRGDGLPLPRGNTKPSSGGAAVGVPGSSSLVYALRHGPHVNWYDLALPLTAHYVDQARTVAVAVGAPLVTVVVPRDAQIDEARLQAQLSQYQLSPGEIELDRPQRGLAASIQELGVPVLDLEPVFRARADRAELFFAHDIHFTPLGHEVAAEALADWLERLGRLPSQ